MAECPELPILYSCPRAPPRLRRHGGAASREFCYRSACSVCPDARFVWRSGFCSSGQWQKKPLEVGPLDPRVWSKLPPDLDLEPITARLPTVGSGRVRSLSKDWNLAMSSSTVTKELQPNLCALLGFTVVTKTCWGWLVLCHAERTSSPFLLNPFTREWRQFPLQRLVLNRPSTVLLRVDRDRGSYKVMVVGINFGLDDGGDFVAEVYESERNEWSAFASRGRVLGASFSWSSELRVSHSLIEVEVYDCSTGKLREYDVDYFPRRPISDPDGVIRLGWEVKGLANHLNDLYLLEKLQDYGLLPGINELPDSCTCYNVLKYEEDQWGFGSNGFRV